MGRFILHSDLNNFYASVECLCNPLLKNKLVVVVGDQEKRHGIVLAKNQLAKSFGVKTGDTVWEAKLKCGNIPITCLTANFARYEHFSKKVKEIYKTFSNNVESYGIDEAWIDVSPIAKNFEEATELAEMIRERVLQQVGLTVSVGVSWNKVFAKLGSDLKKPNAVTVITPQNFKHLVWTRPANELLFVGRATYTKLLRVNIQTIGDIANANIAFLKKLLGKMGEVIWKFANGLDDSLVMKVGERSPVKSIGNSVTCPIDLTDIKQVKSVLYTLSESVAFRMRCENVFCREVQLFVKDKNLLSIERQKKIAYPTNLAKKISLSSIELFVDKYDFSHPVRALGIRVRDFTCDINQLNLFENEEKNKKLENMEKTVDNLREKYGYNIIKRGIVLGSEELSCIEKDIHAESSLHTILQINGKNKT